MRRPLSLAAALLSLTAAVFVTVRTHAQAPAQPQQGPTPPTANARCTFTNPSYSGKCVETVPIGEGGTPASACREILSCLNNPMCTRTFCQATTIRTNWQLESAVPAR
jgi:hypothetical protein